MALVLTNDFTKWQFESDDEAIQAVILPDSNIKYIQNELATAAEEAALLVVPAENQSAYLLEIQFIKGKIAAYKYLLAMSERGYEEFRAKAVKSAAEEAFNRARNPGLNNPDLNR